MLFRPLALFFLIAVSLSPVSAQEHVSIGTQRLTVNGALFLAAAQGYFKAEGVDVEMTAYASPEQVVQALAGGATDLGLAEFTPAAFNFAGRGAIKAIAAQVREKRDYEGNEVMVSNKAYDRGMRKAADIAGTVFAISEIGSTAHFQLGQIARAKGFSLSRITLKSVGSIDAVVRALVNSEVDGAILPTQYARELLVANQAKLITWFSEIDEPQLGALFASAKMLETRRAVVEKFLRAYRRAAADYAAALLRHDRFAKRISDPKSQAAASTIARYVYAGRPLGPSTMTVESSAYYMDPQARLDPSDIARQVEWYKAQKLVDESVDARSIVDSSLNR